MKKIRHAAKDSIFSDLFNQPRYTLELYRSLHPEDSDISENDISDITIRNLVTNGIYNDLGLLVRDSLIILVEAQSTWSNNILFRELEYLAKSLSDYFRTRSINLFSSASVVPPSVELYVIYTGNQKNIPDEISLRSLFYDGNQNAPDVMIKVFREDNSTGIIREYIQFTKILDAVIRKQGKTMQAFQEILETCISENILKEYLTSIERKELKDMAIILYDPDVELQEYIRCEKVHSYEEGSVAGKAEGEAAGKAEGELALARKLLLKGYLNPTQIADVTGLSLMEVNKLMEKE